MKFCDECYTPHPDTEILCTKCGTELTRVPSATEKKLEKKEQKKNEPKKPSFFSNKNNIKALVYAVLGTVVLGGTVYLLINGFPEIETTVPDLDSSITAGDVTIPQTLVLSDTTDRYFSPYGFSFVLPKSAFGEAGYSIYTDASSGLTNYSLLPSEVLALSQQESGSYDVQDLTGQLHSNSEAYGKMVSFTLVSSLLLSETPDDPVSLDSFIQTRVSLTQEDLMVGGQSVRHTVLRISLSDGTESITEMFHMACPGLPGEYFDLMVTSGSETISSEIYLPVLEKVVETFLPNEKLLSVNEEGLGKFKSITFASRYHPEYMKNVLIPYHNSAGYLGFTTEEIPLALTEEGKSANLVVAVDLGMEEISSGTARTYAASGQNFTVYETEVDVLGAEGNSVKDALIVGVSFESVAYPGLSTAISLEVDGQTSDTAYHEEDFLRINSSFQTLMDHLEEDLSPDVLEFYEVMNLSGETAPENTENPESTGDTESGDSGETGELPLSTDLVENTEPAELPPS